MRLCFIGLVATLGMTQNACEKPRSVASAPKITSPASRPSPPAKQRATAPGKEEPAAVSDPLPDAKSLPAPYLGVWHYKKYWIKGRTEGPHGWGRVQIDASTLHVSAGEVSRDSGQRSVGGVYTVVSGEGSRKKPHVVSYHVRKLSNSGTTGYDHNYPVGKTTAARLYITKGELHFDMDAVDSFTLSKPAPEKK